ncbi:MAG TPA: isoprenylcysteine carboxylmethyltransferase family protein, partial [Pyrinomonadaceae bacterium]
LLRAGLYRHVRHPAYTGALLAHLGLGLSFSNWWSLALSVVPYAVAAVYRIRVEERALAEAFGAEYEDYARGTKRLIPKVF